MSECNKDQKPGAVSPPMRNNYFYGKMLDDESLRTEQHYFNEKRWMLNRLGLGSGVLCGLEVSVDGKFVVVSPGVAIDTLGREIVVSSEVRIDPWVLTDGSAEGRTELPRDGSHKVYVCIAYREYKVDYVPVLVTDCDGKKDAPSTIAEGYCLMVKDGNPESHITTHGKLCEALNETDAKARQKKVCEALTPLACGPMAAEVDCLVLANITLDGAAISVEHCKARRLVYSNPVLYEMVNCLVGREGRVGKQGPIGETGPAGPPGQIVIPDLPKIIEINWQHDGEMPASDFFNKSHGLRIVFSEQMRAAAKRKSSNGWFQVTMEVWGGKPRPNAVLGFLSSGWPTFPTGIAAWEMLGLIMETNKLSTMQSFRLLGNVDLSGNTLAFTTEAPAVLPALWLLVDDLDVVIRVVLKSDFLMGKTKNNVLDGDHLRGEIPATGTGDDIPGGDFESWFRLKLPKLDILPPTTSHMSMGTHAAAEPSAGTQELSLLSSTLDKLKELLLKGD